MHVLDRRNIAMVLLKIVTRAVSMAPIATHMQYQSAVPQQAHSILLNDIKSHNSI